MEADSTKDRYKDREKFKVLLKQEKILLANLQRERISDDVARNIEKQLDEIFSQKTFLCKKWGVEIPSTKQIISMVKPSVFRGP